MKEKILGLLIPVLGAIICGYVMGKLVYKNYSDNINNELRSSRIYLVENGKYDSYEEMREDNNLNNYAPTDNYVDLRDYEITDEEFKLLWRCQELLNEYDNNKQSLGSNCINIFGTLKDKYLSSFKENEQ